MSASHFDSDLFYISDIKINPFKINSMNIMELNPNLPIIKIVFSIDSQYPLEEWEQFEKSYFSHDVGVDIKAQSLHDRLLIEITTTNQNVNISDDFIKFYKSILLTIKNEFNFMEIPDHELFENRLIDVKKTIANNFDIAKYKNYVDAINEFYYNYAKFDSR